MASSTPLPNPCRGEIWKVVLDPIVGHEQMGTRPCLVISDDRFNHGPSGLTIVIPITSKNKPLPSRVRIDPPEGGVKLPGYIICENLRSVSKQRLTERWGRVSVQTLFDVEEKIRLLLQL